ncbi:MAG: lipocalin-like domain-containing protein [Bauldia sp.]
MPSDPLVGTWKLLSWRNETSDGTVTYPMGEDAVGFLVYSNDGHVSAHLAKRDRPPFASGDMVGGTEAENTAAMTTHISYVGTYEFQGDVVVHHAKLSSFPNWSGTDQRRRAVFEGNTLLLVGDPMPFHGTMIVAYALWQRAGAGD